VIWLHVGCTPASSGLGLLRLVQLKNKKGTWSVVTWG
jgi:hypothetical protein